MKVGIEIKVSINVIFLLVYLVVEGAIKKTRDENIQKGNVVVLFGFHSELDVGEKDIKMIEERD
jgi:hypothetical protein